MIKLNVFELDKIKQICEAVGTEYFTLDQDFGSGIGSILTLTYETEIADHPAKVSIEVSGVEKLVNIVLIGGKHFGCLALHLLASKSDTVIQRVVITEEDDRLGKLSKKLDYELYVSNPTLVDADAIPDACDLIVTAYTHARVSDTALSKSKLGGIGYHPSLLPRHRGKHAVEDTIACKDLIAGGSVYQLSQKWDEGNILIQDWCKVQPDDDAGTLWRRDLSPMGIRLLSTAIDDIIDNGYIISKPQI